MPSPIGPLRALVFVPGQSEIRRVMGGFERPSETTALELERVTLHLVSGIDTAVRSSSNAEIIAALQPVPARYRGFAFEGAAVGLTALDSLSPGHRAADLFENAENFHFPMYPGVGMALARIPKFRWRKLFPKHPLYRWLAVDGYGFYKAFFHTQKYVRQQRFDTRYPRWMGNRAQVLRIADQGIGRALWFVGGGSAAGLTRLIGQFDPARHADLWSGVGIAVTFAGGVDQHELDELRTTAGEYAGLLGLGAALVAKIRLETDSVDAYTEAVVRTYCGRSMADTDVLVEKSQVDLPADGTAATYQLWRDRIVELIANGS
ncbi:DUF1702 family protein [Nocardia sp. JMUB6875]|uniref:DUF1702 family protein n=1 Tax=Nocardia sp. JMUB6875 TaxID=3158170 RepID=UPI0032E631DE